VTPLKRAHVYEQQALFFRQCAERERHAALKSEEIAAMFDRFAAEERAEAETTKGTDRS
jgi:hypothetical protein